jgi:hypothetical protein
MRRESLPLLLLVRVVAATIWVTVVEMKGTSQRREREREVVQPPHEVVECLNVM